MSDAFAVNAVTATLTQLLAAQLAGVLAGGSVTSRPLDKARDATNLTNQLNVFLWGVSVNAALRNQDMPGVRPGERALAPLALDLHYLLTAYGRDDDQTDPTSHVLLGHAMRALHDNAVLACDDLRVAQPLSDVFQQIERIKISPQSLSVEEVSKLWTIFQVQYRVSTAYQVSVVLIESTKATRTPLPVLKRGPGDRGVTSAPNVSSPLPALTQLDLPAARSGAQLGDAIGVVGTALSGATGARLTHTKLGSSVALPLGAAASATRIPLTITDDPTLWAAGIYSLVIDVRRPSETITRTSNALALALIPTLVTVNPTTAPSGVDLTLTLNVKPAVLPLQRVSVLFGEAELRLPEVNAATSSLSVTIPAPAPGTYLVRVRIDGLDSSPVVQSGTPPVWEFAAAQQVIIT